MPAEKFELARQHIEQARHPWTVIDLAKKLQISQGPINQAIRAIGMQKFHRAIYPPNPRRWVYFPLTWCEGQRQDYLKKQRDQCWDRA